MRKIAALFKKNLHYLFDLAGGILFAVILVGVVKHNFKLDRITPFLTVVIAVAFILLQRLIDRLPSQGPAYWGIIAGVFLVMLIWHTAAAYLLELDIVGGDARVVMTSAMRLVAGETPETTDMFYNWGYFAQYQNQFGYLFLMMGVAKLGMLLTGHVSFTHFAVFNLIVSEISVLMAIICAERIGRKIGIASCGLRTMVIFALAPFLWMMVPYPYTDSLSLPFLLGMILASMYGIDHIQTQKGILLFEEKSFGDVLCFFAIGALIAVGYKVKGNLVILLVALEMILFVKTPLKKWCELSAALVMGFAAVLLIFSLIISGTGLMTKEQSDRYKFPATHWIMMGMDSFGYSGEDVIYTQSFTTYKEKKEAVAQRMKEKLDRMGVNGLLRHIYKKTTAAGWESGMFSMDMLLSLNSGSIKPKRYSGIHDYILKSGPHHEKFRPWANAYCNALEILALLGFFSFGRKKKETSLVLMRLFITGSMLFFMMWESNSKYMFSAALFVSILAAFEMESLSHVSLPVRQKEKRGTPSVERLVDEMTQSVDEVVSEQIEWRHYAEAEKAVAVYRRVGEAIAYGSVKQKTVSAKAEMMRKALSERKAQQRVVDNAKFYLDLWKKPDEIAQAQLSNIIRSGIQLRGKLADLDGAQMGESVAELIREMDMRIQVMQSRLPEDERPSTGE